MDLALWIILGVVVLLLLVIWFQYNGLVRLSVRVDEAWSDITVQLKRRADLIPQIVNTVKGYAAHEKGVFESVTNARAATLSAQGPAQTAQAEGELQGALKSLFAVAEAYPELKANTNFLQLQQELVDTEDKIMASRRFYNAGVKDLNTRIRQFPGNIFANLFHINNREFFEVDESTNAAIQNPVNVEF
ncbi:MAG: LemA family protein [Bifidobacteriaceae bacterium]|jgi:LemA protein|nr:LemA family protein [Bifidobacteriaceae bacterium]